MDSVALGVDSTTTGDVTGADETGEDGAEDGAEDDETVSGADDVTGERGAGALRTGGCRIWGRSCGSSWGRIGGTTTTGAGATGTGATGAGATGAETTGAGAAGTGAAGAGIWA